MTGSFMDKGALKNLVSNQDLYEKEESFGDFRSKLTVDRDALKLRLRDFGQRPDGSGDPYQREIVRRAIRDLLSTSGEEGLFRLYPQAVGEMSRLSDDLLERYLFYRYRYEVFPQTHELDAFPPCLQVEVTSACNYRCVFCYQTDAKLTDPKAGHMGTMSLDLFKRIIDESEGRCEAITIASRGEPLIAKELGKMLFYMKGKFLASKINTNASLLTEQKCHEILSSGIHTVVFSIDAAREPLYSRLRVNGKLDRVLANVRRFYEIKTRHYPQSPVTTRVSGVKVNTDQHMDEMERFWGDLVDEVAFVKYNPWENTYERPLNEVSQPCSDLWRRMFIWWDGRVNPCDVDYLSKLSVGRVPESAVSELWTSEAYDRLRKMHLASRRAGLFPCNRCTQV